MKRVAVGQPVWVCDVYAVMQYEGTITGVKREKDCIDGGNGCRVEVEYNGMRGYFDVVDTCVERGPVFAGAWLAAEDNETCCSFHNDVEMVFLCFDKELAQDWKECQAIQHELSVSEWGVSWNCPNSSRADLILLRAARQLLWAKKEDANFLPVQNKCNYDPMYFSGKGITLIPAFDFEKAEVCDVSVAKMREYVPSITENKNGDLECHDDFWRILVANTLVHNLLYHRIKIPAVFYDKYGEVPISEYRDVDINEALSASHVYMAYHDVMWFSAKQLYKLVTGTTGYKVLRAMESRRYENELEVCVETPFNFKQHNWYNAKIAVCDDSLTLRKLLRTRAVIFADMEDDLSKVDDTDTIFYDVTFGFDARKSDNYILQGFVRKGRVI